MEQLDKNTDIGISTVRILAMLGIVICHTICYYTFIPQHEHLGQLFNSGVGIFLFLSGLLYGSKYDKRYDLSFYIGRLKKIWFPVMIWSTLLFVMQGCHSVHGLILVLLNLEGLGFLNNKVITFSTGIDGTGHLWFITAIMMCYLLLPLLSIIRKSLDKKIIAVFVLLIWFFTLLAGLGGGWRLSYFALFILGYYWKTLLPGLRRKAGSRWILYICLLMIMMASLLIRIGFRRYYDGTNFYNNVITSIAMTIFELSFILFVLIFCDRHKGLLQRISTSRLYRYFDVNNFYIYIVHMYFISFTYEKLNLSSATMVFLFTVGGAAPFLRYITECILKCVDKRNNGKTLEYKLNRV